MITPIFFADNINGQLIYRNEKQYKEWLKRCPREVHVVIKSIRRKRSSNQNRYFHGVVIPLIAEALGEGYDETKDILKSLFLKKEYFLKTKSGKLKEVKVVALSRELNTKEFEEFMEHVRRFASIELGLNIPEPSEMELI